MRNETLAWLTLFVGVPLNALAAYLLRRTSRAAPQLRVLRERYRTAAAFTIFVLFFGLIFVQNDMKPPPLSLDTTKVITRSAILLMSLFTAGGWLWLWRGHGKPRPPSS